MRVEESSIYAVMKTRIIFVLVIAFAVNTFAEPILRYSAPARCTIRPGNRRQACMWRFIRVFIGGRVITQKPGLIQTGAMR